MNYRVSSRPWEWNPWPLTRLVVVLAVLALQAHLCGWAVPWELFVDLPGRVLTTAIGLLFFSATLACLYAFLWTLPLLLVLLFNDWLYEGSRWIIRILFKLRPGCLLAGASLCLEAAVFVGGFSLLLHFFVGI